MLDTETDTVQVADGPAARPTPDDQPAQPAPAGAEELVVADLLVEDVSIDGMCGVY